MKTPQRTPDFAWDSFMECVEAGMIPACVPVIVDMEQAVYTEGQKYDPSKIESETDRLALAILAIDKAWKSAQAANATPVL